MKTLNIIGSLIAACSIIAALFISMGAGRQKMTQAEVLKTITSAIESRKELNLKILDCRIVLGYDTNGSAKCYASPLESKSIVKSVQNALSSIASTPGWTEDYGVLGAFYAVKVDPKMTFGVAIKPIANSRDFEGVKEVVGEASVITISADSRRKP